MVSTTSSQWFGNSIYKIYLFSKINMTGVTCGTGTAYPSEAPEFTPSF